MSNKKNIAIITGGHGPERSISLLSAGLVRDSIDSNLYECYTIYFDENKWYESPTGNLVDRNDFSININREKVTFEMVFLVIHGTPVEDGKIQGYFEALNIPYSACDTFVSALTFNKYVCKQVLKNYGIPMARSRMIRKGEDLNYDYIEKLGLPLFVKPNNNGSSYGISKVMQKEDLQTAIEFGFKYDDELILEAFMKGREFSSGAVRINNKITTFPLTEIISHNDFFDFKAKYENESQEITPAQISDELSHICQAYTHRIYEKLNAKGIIRVDYILIDKVFHMIEVNTIPGLSPESIVPQQIRAHGWTCSKVINALIAEEIQKNN